MATKEIREASVSSFPFWASESDLKNMEYIRDAMPRPDAIAPTARIANNYVLSYALLRAANKLRAEHGDKAAKKKAHGDARNGTAKVHKSSAKTKRRPVA